MPSTKVESVPRQSTPNAFHLIFSTWKRIRYLNCIRPTFFFSVGSHRWQLKSMPAMYIGISQSKNFTISSSATEKSIHKTYRFVRWFSEGQQISGVSWFQNKSRLRKMPKGNEGSSTPACGGEWIFTNGWTCDSDTFRVIKMRAKEQETNK